MSNGTVTADEPAQSSAPPAPSRSPAPSASQPPAISSPPPASASQRASPVPPPASSPPPSPSPPPASPNSPAGVTIVVTASTPSPSTDVYTSLVVVSTPGTVIVTVRPSGGQVTVSAPRPTSTDSTSLQNQSKNSSNGLSTGGKTAIAVVIPVVVVALLVLVALFFWRRRKQEKNNEVERRKEVEEYGYNPNQDPTLPTMAEDESGYRGWGNTQTSSNRKASTTLASGMAYSDNNSNPSGYAPVSPVQGGASSEANSEAMLMRDRHEAVNADGLGALGAVGGAAPNSTQHASGIRRGISNASSSYSAANYSDHSGELGGMSSIHSDYYNDNSHGYYQQNPYQPPDAYAAGSQPVIRDVSARRNTRIEKPTVFPPQGNAGIAQNF